MTTNVGEHQVSDVHLMVQAKDARTGIHHNTGHATMKAGLLLQEAGEDHLPAAVQADAVLHVHNTVNQE